MSLKLRKIDGRWIWVALGIVAIVLRYWLGANPQLIETYYSRGIFPYIRLIFDHSLAFLPFPLFLPLLFLALILLIVNVVKWWRKPLSFWKKIPPALLSIAALVSALVFFFLLLWGFNYGRIPIEQQLKIELKPLSAEELVAELEEETLAISQIRDAIPHTTTAAMDASFLPEDLEYIMRKYVRQTLKELGYPNTGKVKARFLKPRGTLLRIGTAGFYLPFTGECNVDAGLHPIQLPFVLAHEYAHGYGIADEGSCNFIAYLACKSATEHFVQYSGHFGYWRYLRGSFFRQNPEVFKLFKEQVPIGIRADIQAIRVNSALYPDIFPKFRDYTYDAYLKAQGIGEGLQNYNRVVLLVKGWKEK